MKIKVEITYIVDVGNDWYEGEKLTEKETLKRLKEDFSDISVFSNHCNYETLKGVEVEKI